MHARDFSAGLRVERLAGADHVLHQEDPQTVNRLLLAWLETNTPQPTVAQPTYSAD